MHKITNNIKLRIPQLFIFFCIKYNTKPKDINNTNEPQQYGEDSKFLELLLNVLIHIAS